MLSPVGVRASRGLIRLATRRRRRAATLATLGAIAAVLAAYGSSTSWASGDVAHKSAALTNVTVRLDWFAGGYHAGFYVAVAEGFYKRAGLNVTVQEGTGSSSTVQLVGAGQDTFGFVDPVAMIPAVAAGAPVEMVADIIQQDPSGVLVVNSSGIKSPAQLAGHQCAESPYGYIHQLLPLFYQRAHVNGSAVQVTSISPAAIVPALAHGTLPATCDALFENYYLKNDFNVATTYYQYKNYGIHLLGHGIVVNKSTIASDPSEVKGFVKATIDGYTWAFAHPQQAATIVKNAAPDSSASIADDLDTLKAVKQDDHTSHTKGLPLGVMSWADWNVTEGLMIRYLGLTKPPVTSTLFTNKFLK